MVAHDHQPCISSLLVVLLPVHAWMGRRMERVRAYCRVTLPPLPPLKDLDRLDDESLDMRQHFLSGHFYSTRLEAAYADHLHSIWRPRIRCLAIMIILWELYAMIDSFHCQCGTRVGTYEGWALVWSFALPSTMALITLLIHSPYLNTRLKRCMPLIMVAIFLTTAAGYTAPLGVYLMHAQQEHSREELLSKAEGSAIAQEGAWFSSTIAVLSLACSTAGISVGAGAIPIISFLPLPMIALTFYENGRLNKEYGVIASVWAQTLPVFFVCAILTWFQTTISRQHYMMRIYKHFQRELRVEQLLNEKERLDYERRFALKNRGQLQKPDGKVSKSGDQVSQGGSNASLKPRSRMPSCLSSPGTSVSSDAELGALPCGEILTHAANESRVSASCYNRAQLLMNMRASTSSARELESCAPWTNPMPSLTQGDISECELGLRRELGDRSESDAASQCNGSPDASFTTSCSMEPTFSAERERALSCTLDTMGIRLTTQ
jgi:hypothetical protein